MAAAILVIVWLLWPIVAFAGGLGFAPLSGLAAIPLIPGAVKRFKPRLYMLAWIAFFVFAGVTAAWSPAKFDVLKAGYFKIALLLGAIGILISAVSAMTPKRRDLVIAVARAALLAQVVIVLVLALFETQALQLFSPLMPNSGEGVQNISRNSIIMAAAAPALIMSIFGRRAHPVTTALAICVLAAEVAPLLMRDVGAGPMALAAGAICAGIAALRPRDGFRIIAICLALAILVAPFAFDWLTHGADATKATTSAGQRLAIWATAIDVIRDHPNLGGGIGVLREMKQLIGSGMFADQQVIPNHPHNMALQLWAETGAVGATLFAALLVLAGWRLPGPREMGPGGVALAGLIGGTTAIGFVSFDLWNEGWWGACGLLTVLCGALARQPAEEDAAKRAPVIDPGRKNNFNLLRLTFALFVAAYHLTFLSNLPLLGRFTPFTSIAAELGVQGFFVLSGYLVYASLQHSQSIAVYAEKRIRRLYPAYIVVILGCAAFAYAVSPIARASLGQVSRYIGSNLVFLNFLEPELPGVFSANRVSQVNGALWTLKIEVMFYLLLPLLAWLIQAAGKYRLVVLALLYAGAEAWRMGFALLPGSRLFDLEHQLPGQLSFFVVGMACWLLRDRIVWRWWLVAMALVMLAASFLSPWLMPLRPLGIGLTAIWIAVGVPQIVDVARFGDLSYGIYIIHFPIIQAVIRAGLFKHSPEIGLGVSMVAMVVGAFLLWHLVEKPALRRDSAYRHKGEIAPTVDALQPA